MIDAEKIQTLVAAARDIVDANKQRLTKHKNCFCCYCKLKKGLEDLESVEGKNL